MEKVGREEGKICKCRLLEEEEASTGIWSRHPKKAIGPVIMVSWMAVGKNSILRKEQQVLNGVIRASAALLLRSQGG